MQGLQHVKEVLIDTFDRLDVLNSEEGAAYRALSTGIGSLDAVITGLNRSDLIILAARPGMGKTSFALNIARHVAVKVFEACSTVFLGDEQGTACFTPFSFWKRW